MRDIFGKNKMYDTHLSPSFFFSGKYFDTCSYFVPELRLGLGLVLGLGLGFGLGLGLGLR